MRRWLLPAAFLLIIIAFAVGNFVALMSARRIHAANRRISETAIVSIEDLSQIVHDIDQERLLVAAHIFETSPEQMLPLERRLSQIGTNLDSVARAYEPLTTFPSENAIWRNLWQEIGALHRPIQEVLDLSRNNQDAEARAAMRGIEKRFDAINQEAEQLIKVNRDAAGSAAAEIRALERRSLRVLGGITLSGTALALFLAWWVTRSMRKQDEQISLGTQLLETRNRELDAFAGRVAHDLRNPLTNINLSTVRLAKYGPERETAIAVLRRSVSQMETLIRDLLALSRIDAELAGAATETSTIARTLEEELTPKVKSADGILRLQLEPASVQCSEGLLRQALWNIGENAVKYRRPEVQLEIDIRGREVRGWYQFRVSDNGTGMSSEEARHIFEPFFRAANVRSISGTGLGLSIVKRVVEASGGRVSVASELGKGTTFIIDLPLGRSDSWEQSA